MLLSTATSTGKWAAALSLTPGCYMMCFYLLLLLLLVLIIYYLPVVEKSSSHR